MPGIELNWPHKDRVLYTIPQRGTGHKPVYYGDPGAPSWPDHRPLLPVNSHGTPDADPCRLIQGDNLVGLQALLDEGLAGRFQCIYIDPPFNTGTAFEHYDDGYEHTIWLGLMRDRLKLLHKLLADTGLAFVHIDNNQVGYLQIMMDAQFGRGNFVQIVSVKRASPAGFKTINPGPVTVTDFILLYAKDKAMMQYQPLYLAVPYDDNYNLFIENPQDEPENWTFSKINDIINERYGFKNWREAKAAWGNEWKLLRQSHAGQFALENKARVVSVRDPHKPTERFRQALEASASQQDKVLVLHREDAEPILLLNGGALAFYKNKVRQVNGEDTPTEMLTDFWGDMNFSGIAKEGGVTFKNSKKPEALLRRVIELSTQPGDWVLDSFAGSGTTAAVAYQMGRKWVTIEQGEHARTHCLPRLERVRLGTAPYKAAAGGGFIFQQVGPPLVEHNEELGIPTLNPLYVNGQYQKAVCLLTGFTHRPSDPLLHGRASTDGGRYCHVAERGLLVTEDYLAPLRDTLSALAPPTGLDAPTCVVYATRTASHVGGDGVEVVRIPAGFTKKKP